MVSSTCLKFIVKLCDLFLQKRPAETQNGLKQLHHVFVRKGPYCPLGQYTILFHGVFNQVKGMVKYHHMPWKSWYTMVF